MRNIFGWDLPPGCRASDIPGNGPEQPCECCGNGEDSCECPECPVCSTYGDKNCYEEHGLKFTDKQLAGQSKLKVKILEQQITDEKEYQYYLKEKEVDLKDIG